MSWDDPHAWRNSYDAWKTREPDYYDDEPLVDDDPGDYPRIRHRRHTLRDTATRSIDGNPAALVARELTRASFYPRRIIGAPALSSAMKAHMRANVDLARRLRTFIGPPCPDDMIPF